MGRKINRREFIKVTTLAIAGPLLLGACKSADGETTPTQTITAPSIIPVLTSTTTTSASPTIIPTNIPTIASTEAPTNVPTATPTETSPSILTQTATITSENISTPAPENPPKDEWLLAGERFFCNEKYLLAGDIKIIYDKEAIERKHTEFLESLYDLNSVGENSTILNKYPTADRFTKAAKSGKPINGLMIPVGNASDMGRGLTTDHTKFVKFDEDIYLDKLAIRVLHPSETDLYLQSYNLATDFIHYDLPNHALFDFREVEDRKTLQITLARRNQMGFNMPYNRFTLDALGDENGNMFSEEEKKKNNLLAANQSFNVLNRMMPEAVKISHDSFEEEGRYAILVGFWINCTSLVGGYAANYQKLATEDPLFVANK
jgi:hypothetical protein